MRVAMMKEKELELLFKKVTPTTTANEESESHTQTSNQSADESDEDSETTVILRSPDGSEQRVKIKDGESKKVKVSPRKLRDRTKIKPPQHVTTFRANMAQSPN